MISIMNHAAHKAAANFISKAQRHLAGLETLNNVLIAQRGYMRQKSKCSALYVTVAENLIKRVHRDRRERT